MILSIYYSIGILVLLSTIKNLFYFKKISSVREWYFKFYKITGKKPSRQNFRSKSDFDRLINQNILAIFELSWILLLIFTNNWLIFPIIVILNLSIATSITRIKSVVLNQFLYFIYLTLKVLIYCYIIADGLF